MIKNPQIGQRVYYVGSPSLGDDLVESQIIVVLKRPSADTTELWFDGKKRVHWIDADVAFETEQKAKLSIGVR